VESKKILRGIRSLEKKVQSLSEEMESLKARKSSFSPEGLLSVRGMKVFRKNPAERLFFPPDLPPSDRTRFYELMKRYSFRLVVRDMIKHQDLFEIGDLTHYCSSEVVQEYCRQLSNMGVLRRIKKGNYRTEVSPLYSFGATLEWFIAEMFEREFASPSIYGVSVKEMPAGGDYDVISSWNRRLVYSEVKSSPPKGIESGEISTFFSRMEDLLPDLAILFNDTQLRMKDKLVVMFEEELERRYGSESRETHPVERLVEELFHVRNRVFIVNSTRDVADNFRICLRHFLRYSLS
jgi:hypothetical protein